MGTKWWQLCASLGLALIAPTTVGLLKVGEIEREEKWIKGSVERQGFGSNDILSVIFIMVISTHPQDLIEFAQLALQIGTVILKSWS